MPPLLTPNNPFASRSLCSSTMPPVSNSLSWRCRLPTMPTTENTFAPTMR